MATNSLPQLNTLQPISASAVHVLARMAARRAVQEQLRADGVRVTLVKPADIAAQAKVYLEQHPELYQQALERARLIDEMEEARKARRRKLSMVTPDRPVR